MMSSNPNSLESVLQNGNPIVLFDGVCNVCSASVRFIVQRDPEAKFRFASLQSQAGQKLIDRFPEMKGIDSVVLIEGDRCCTESTAVFRICRHLKGAWKLPAIFLAVPRRLRDAGYRFAAKRRYRWFGKKEACMIPTPELRSRFIQDVTDDNFWHE